MRTTPVSRSKLAPVVGRLALAGLRAAAWIVPAVLIGGSGAPHRGNPAVMTDAQMRAHANAWWSKHATVGASAPAGTRANATVTVRNFQFDGDNNLSTQVDTVRIATGEAVIWAWVEGFHTITNGTGSMDPNAGTLFDQPSDNTHMGFVFAFGAAGTYPYFCRFHEGSNMRGVIVVSPPVSVGPGGARLGFVAGPEPNPTSSGVRFAYALATPGPVRAEVYDVRGRRVALISNRAQSPGSHTGEWDGSTGAGRARAGVYYLRLRGPGFDQTRRFVIER